MHCFVHSENLARNKVKIGFYFVQKTMVFGPFFSRGENL